jgi:hypothetical protein
MMHDIAVIVANCGEKVRDLLMSGHRHLTPKIIRRIANSHPDRQRCEMDQVRRGNRPLKARPGVFDTKDFGEIDSRLRRAGGLLNKAAQLSERLSARTLEEWAAATVSEARQHLTHCAQLRRLIFVAFRRRPTGSADTRPATINPPRDWTDVPDTKISLNAVAGAIHRSGSWIMKSVHDLRRAPHLFPSREQTHAFEVRLHAMIQSCHHIIDALSRPSL